ncbi:Arsenate reductase [Rhodovulum sp. P5]|uniref:arsenate reductase/protein-tyrosine-phosphatase family protein n=1 Tax=Rhodovulum sp. P5 TaxID=1564506 RepID=UPI0009C261F7|nr:helix-turn-helix domain-containing protein [Rhodovulum sp. P5]ARE40137.1 Arsenate reductase [Rhodovulum sp. P5]
MEKEYIASLATLGHAGRMAVFRLLMRRYPQAVRAGDLAAALSLKPSTLSMYLSALQNAGLVAQQREGTARLYRARMDRAEALIDFLFADCCRARPQLCAPPLPLSEKETQEMPIEKYNVLFICTGNSARSIFAESILRGIAGDRFTVYSAGTKPYSELNPIAIETLKDKGYDVSGLRAKNVNAFRGPDAPRLDFVFTVCDQAANEECPPWEGQPITGHWGVPDPVKAEGTEAEKRLAFQHAYGQLKNRITAFAALPLATLDRVGLQSAVDHIADDMETA